MAALSLTGVVLGMQTMLVKPSGRRGPGAREYGLLVLPARLPEVHVHIDEARRDHTAADVDDLAVLVGGNVSHTHHFPIFDENVRLPVQILGRVHHPASAQQQTHGSSSPAPNRRYRTAILTASPLVT